MDSSSTRAQKMVRTTQISVLLANTSPLETMKVTATNNTDRTFARAATMRPSNNAELIFSSETTIGILANDGKWAFAASMMPTNDSGWAFAETALAMPANNCGWAFAETTPAIPANDDRWAFTKTVR